MATRIGAAIALSVILIAARVEAQDARPHPESTADAVAGRAFALLACTGCHVVSPDQPFAPDVAGAPDFQAIANRPDLTAASLRRRIAMLPQVPPHGRMANPQLNATELANVVAYISSLRGRGAGQ